jgi:hypothetical protein
VQKVDEEGRKRREIIDQESPGRSRESPQEKLALRRKKNNIQIM